MLTEEFIIKVIDFGTAKILGKSFDKINMVFINEEDKDNKRKKPDINDKAPTFVGTIEFMSPEMIKNDMNQGFAVDLWSLGNL